MFVLFKKKNTLLKEKQSIQFIKYQKTNFVSVDIVSRKLLLLKTSKRRRSETRANISGSVWTVSALNESKIIILYGLGDKKTFEGVTKQISGIKTSE